MNAPNLLSILRLALVPVFAGVFFGGEENAHLLAAGIYALASLTDVLDGWIARRFKLVTRLGRILDPLADKLMAFTVMICIAMAEIVPVWTVVIFFLKEALMGLGAMTIYQKTDDVMPSNWLGKGATATFFIVCVGLMVFSEIPTWGATTLISIALSLTIAAMLNYLRLYRNYLRKKSK